MRTVAWLNKKYGTLHRETGEPFAEEVRAELMPLCDQDAAEAVIYARGAALKEAHALAEHYMAQRDELRAQITATDKQSLPVADPDDDIDPDPHEDPQAIFGDPRA